MTAQRPAQTAKRHITELLDDLPSESLSTVEQFVRFLCEQKRKEQPIVGERASFAHPAVSLPASSLDAWTNLLSEGYQGNALADTEALYDAA